jgi:hypothetical protein
MLQVGRRTVLGAGIMAVLVGSAGAEGLSGGGGSIWIGTGAPNSVDAASELAEDVGADGRTGNWSGGLQGFYQGDRYRLGGAIQGQAWGGANAGKYEADDGAAGVATIVGGLYATYTFRHDRVLVNAGGIVGAGRALLGFSLDGGDVEDEENVATFYLEPHVSVGVATCRWFGVEFQLSAPIYVLTEELRLETGGKTYTVKSGDLAGVNFALKLTFGKVAGV